MATNTIILFKGTPQSSPNCRKSPYPQGRRAPVDLNLPWAPSRRFRFSRNGPPSKIEWTIGSRKTCMERVAVTARSPCDFGCRLKGLGQDGMSREPIWLKGLMGAEVERLGFQVSLHLCWK